LAERHLLQPLDLMADWVVNEHNELTYTRNDRKPEEECFVRMPFEVPAYMRIVRILKHDPETLKHPTQYSGRVSVGSTIELDYYTLGVKVYLRYGKDGTLRIITEDGDGRETVAKWERET
jgi:hypothetical protein